MNLLIGPRICEHFINICLPSSDPFLKKHDGGKTSIHLLLSANAAWCGMRNLFRDGFWRWGWWRWSLVFWSMILSLFWRCDSAPSALICCVTFRLWNSDSHRLKYHLNQFYESFFTRQHLDHLNKDCNTVNTWRMIGHIQRPTSEGGRCWPDVHPVFCPPA